MSCWILEFTPEAEQDLAKLNRDLRRRINEKLDWLQANFDEITPLALSDKWRGFFKLRVGDWRVIYKIEWGKNLIRIWIIDRRDKVYKRKTPV